MSTFFKVSKENNTEFEKAAEAVEIPKHNLSEEEKSDNQGGPEKLDDSEFTGEENDINNLLEDESGESIREISNKLEKQLCLLNSLSLRLSSYKAEIHR